MVSNPPSGSPRKRGFKARRASIACQRCRKLKKSCQPTDRERCERCCQSDQVCAYMPVHDDPWAPRAPGPSSTVLVPNSPTISPTEPLPFDFDLYHHLSPGQPDGTHHPPHAPRSNHLPFHSARPMHNPNHQFGGLSIPSGPIVAQPPSIFPPDTFSPRDLDTTFPFFHDGGLYDDGLQAVSAQTPPSFTSSHPRPAEEVVDPLYPHHYLRQTPNPSLRPHNIDDFTIANPAPLSLNPHDTTSSLPNFSYSDLPDTSNSNLFDMSRPSALYAEDSCFQSSYEPCSVCFVSGQCALHSYNYHCEEDETD